MTAHRSEYGSGGFIAWHCSKGCTVGCQQNLWMGGVPDLFSRTLVFLGCPGFPLFMRRRWLKVTLCWFSGLFLCSGAGDTVAHIRESPTVGLFSVLCWYDGWEGATSSSLLMSLPPPCLDQMLLSHCFFRWASTWTNALWVSWKMGSKVVNFDKLFLHQFLTKIYQNLRDDVLTPQKKDE